MLELWRTPHTFGLIPVEGDERPLPPIGGFTYGPVAADLVMLTEPSLDTVIRLGRTLGFEWVASLVAVDRTAALPESALGTFLKERYALRPGLAPNPFGVRGGELVRRHHRPIPTSVLTDFVDQEAGRLEYIGTTLRPLVGPLLAIAARRASRVTFQPQRAAELLNALGSPLKVQRVSNEKTSETICAYASTDLYTRALLEIIELYSDMPQLGICARCTRLFVPQRSDEKHCRRHIWAVSGGEQLAGCIYDNAITTTRANLDAEAHRREYKRRQMRVVRAKKSFGRDNPRTKREQKRFDDWKRAHPTQRGRRQTPFAPELLPQ
jgi:hypothetical protein